MTAIIRKVTEIGLGDSADPTKNFKILVPDVADGTLKITRGDGTAVLSIDAAGKAVFPGNAQTWQNMTASRSIGTTYTNNTGQLIKVSIIFNPAASGADTIVVSGITVAYAASYSTSASGIYADVPNGATYVASSGGATVNTWVELR